MLVNQPAILSGAFAAEGDKNTIPANNDGLSGLASIAKGFPPITQVPLAQGGQPPQRQDFNGIFNLFSQFLLYAQNGGVYAYNNTLDYQPPAIIASDNVFYQCVAENGPSTSAGVQPVTNTTYWKKLVPDVAVMKGATASVAGAAGLVPAPAAGDNDEFLRGDGTWKPINTMKGASVSAAGSSGLVPAPGAGAANRYLRSDGSWQVPPDTKYSNMKGATASVAGSAGLAPAPTAGAQNKFLRGDGTWADAKMSTKELVDILYPVGHIYMSTNKANPGTLFPGTTWEAYAQGRVLIGVGTGTDSRSERKTFAAGSTGGEYYHQLTVRELATHTHTAASNNTGAHTHTFGYPRGDKDYSNGNNSPWWGPQDTATKTTNSAGNHTHTITVNNAGSNAAHNNLQPYLAVYIWQRTA